MYTDGYGWVWMPYEQAYTYVSPAEDDAYAYVSGVMTRNMMARDAAEGIDAFLTKRQPTWTGT